MFKRSGVMTTVSQLVCMGVLICASAITLCAQTTSATLSGTITDPMGNVVPGAEVAATNVDTGISTSTKTNEVGIYVMPSLQPGRYRITVTQVGFKQITLTDVVLNVQDTVSRNFNLELGAISESITVNGDTVNLNTQDASVSTVIDRQFVENIPLNGRSFQSLIAVSQGVVSVPGATIGAKGEFSVNGQRTEANYYTVDGVSATNGSYPISGGLPNGFSGNVPNETALGTTQSLVSLDALQEFRMLTSSYSAEYGRTPGGQISFVTRSGTNDWHGTGFDYLRNGVLDANNWFNNFSGLPKTSERQNDFGGTLGGPLTIPHIFDGRDRTFFFFSYEGLRLSAPQPAQTSLVPDLTLRQTAPAAIHPYLNAFPIPNGPSNGDGSAQFTAAFSTPGTMDASSIRIDHTFNSKWTLFGRYSDSPSNTITRPGAPTSLNNLSTNSSSARSLTLATTAIVTSHLRNELRFNDTWTTGQVHESLDNFGGAVPFGIGDLRDANGQPTPQVDAVSFLGLFSDANWYMSLGHNFGDRQRQLNVVNVLNYSFGSQSVKFGLDYRRLVTPFSIYRLDELAFYLTPASVLQNLPTASLRGTVVPVSLGSAYNNLSLFVHDEWKAERWLNLSLGLRWELNPPPTDIYGNLPYTVNQVTNLATTALAPKRTPLWKTTYGNFAPRLGAAYQVSERPGSETVIRGGFGLFYDTGSTYGSQGYGGVGYFARPALGNVPFPFTVAQTTLPPPSVAPPYNSVVFGFDPHLQLPYTLQWNAAIEQAVGKSQTLTVSYVGAVGRRLLWARQIHPSNLGNPNFSSANGLDLTTNASSSSYNALQIQVRRKLTNGLQALASYTWSHSIDDTSTNFLTQQLLRGSSDFDIRHNFQLATTYDIPGKYENHFTNMVLRDWSLHGRITGHTGLPFDVTGGTIFVSSGLQTQLRANLVPGQQLYVDDPAAPGRSRVNYDAFTIPTVAEQTAGQFGDAPRNLLRGFSLWQVDGALNRQFKLGEVVKLQFRGEAFNLLNHPIFGAIQNSLTSGRALFGRATGTANSQLGGLNAIYQIGGPRSVQISMKLQF
jgi:hypothetical protein